MSAPSELKLLLRDVNGAPVQRLCYEEHLWGQLDDIQAHEKKGMKSSESLLRDLRTRLALQKAFAEMKNLGLKSEQHYAAFENSRKRGLEAAKEADKLEASCVEGLTRWLKNGKLESESLAKKAGELGDTLKEHEKQVESTRETYLKCADEGEKALREYEYSEKNKLLDAKEIKAVQ